MQGRGVFEGGCCLFVHPARTRPGECIASWHTILRVAAVRLEVKID